MTYRPTWRQEDEGAFGSASYLFPAAVNFDAPGEAGEPHVTARFEMRDGIPEVVDFRLTAVPGGRPVRTADLNAWQPLEGLAINAFRKFARKREPEPGTPAYGHAGERDFWSIGSDLERAQTSRRGPSEAELREVARVYRDAIDARPVQAVQMYLGCSPRTASRRVKQAEDAGFLPRTTPGRRRKG